MLILFFQCAGCGAENDIPAPEQITRDGLLRGQIMPRCKCRRCGYVGASDMRLYYDAGANALDGARVRD